VPRRREEGVAVRAFPGAQGWGAESIGGRGGKVIEVTTLADGVPAPVGSFRAALQAVGPRTIVFRVGGIIKLTNLLKVGNPFLTIAGQTAPGGGVLITGHTGIVLATNDIIMRYLRFRLDGTGGIAQGQVNVGIANGSHHVIIDHCSLSWAFDENMYIWKTESPVSPDITDITIQRCFIAEGLAGHGHGLLIGGQDPSDDDPSLPSDAYLKVHRISTHHNLFAHNYDRNPRMSSAGCQVINNVVYNWGSHVGVSARKNTVDFINNYWKPGPMSKDIIYMHERLNELYGYEYPDPSILIRGNRVVGRFDNPLADNGPLIVQARTKADPFFRPLPASYRRSIPIAQAPFPISIQTPNNTYVSVLDDVGANAGLDSSGLWWPNSDAVDLRVLADVEGGTGWTDLGVTSPEAAGGFPTIAGGVAPVDTDHDGIPDEWESARELNPADAADAQVVGADGYTNLEKYLNGL
jgi:pectate lyase